MKKNRRAANTCVGDQEGVGREGREGGGWRKPASRKWTLLAAS